MNNQIQPFNPDTLDAIAQAKLNFPFRLHEHKFLQGNVYIREPAIANRLDSVDPNWQFHIAKYETLDYGVVCIGQLMIRGIIRANAGAGAIQQQKSGGEKIAQYQLADNVGNGYKSAATDALKRSARLFGVGRYLLGAPKEAEFARWLEAQLKVANEQYKNLNVTAIGEVTNDDE